jgi:tetratricopeptide (TPR) repeat protein
MKKGDEPNIMTDEITHDDVARQFHLLRSDTQKYLKLTNALVEGNPQDADAYFIRHQAWSRLGQLHLALADLDASLAFENHHTTHRARGLVLHRLGRYREAVDAYDRSEQIDPMAWKGGFGPLLRADSYARLGDEAAALADCDTLPDDHWTPGLFDMPAGYKQEVAAELRRRAAAARGEK